jgi:hypothetical protein
MTAPQLTPRQMKGELPAYHHSLVDKVLAEPGMGVAPVHPYRPHPPTDLGRRRGTEARGGDGGGLGTGRVAHRAKMPLGL